MGAVDTSAPVTAAELAEVERLVAGTPRHWKPLELIAARTLLPRLAADLRAIDDMLSEAGIGRHGPADTIRDRVARMIADANTEGLRTLAAEAERDALAASAASPSCDGMYFIQDMRSYVGDAILWWRPESAGYTTDIDRAGQYSEEEARRIERVRGTEKAIPVEVALSAASRVVNAAALHRALAKHARSAADPTEGGA